MARQLKPSDLTGIHPWSSVDRKSETESAMAWLVQKLAATGDEFRYIPHEEYLSWEGWRDAESFKHFQKYLKSSDTIVLYSPSYAAVADKLAQE